MLGFSVSGASHVGLVRELNQDAAAAGSRMLLVADGVGGGAAGEIASAVAAYAVHDVVARASGARSALVAASAVHLAQRSALLGILLDPSRQGMATTLTGVLTNGTDFALLHLGDSRAYVLRGDEFVQLTRDHTWVERAVLRGQITEEQAAEHPWRNVILRSVNGGADQYADILPLGLRVGDRVLVASDGLTDLVAPKRLEELCLGYGPTAGQDLCEALVEEALSEGGRDNITVLVGLVVDDAEANSADAQWWGSLSESGHAALAADLVEQSRA